MPLPPLPPPYKGGGRGLPWRAILLILTRRLGEGIRIGDDVRIVILEVKGNQVKVGVEAPSSALVYRDEIYARIIEENRKASSASLEHLKILIENLKVKK